MGHEDKDKKLGIWPTTLREGGVQQCGDRLGVFRVLLKGTAVAFSTS